MPRALVQGPGPNPGHEPWIWARAQRQGPDSGPDPGPEPEPRVHGIWHMGRPMAPKIALPVTLSMKCVMNLRVLRVIFRLLAKKKILGAILNFLHVTLPKPYVLYTKLWGI